MNPAALILLMGAAYYAWQEGLFNSLSDGSIGSQTGSGEGGAAPVLSSGAQGMRNNNPGNLKGGGAWLGLTGTDPRGFNTYDTLQHGLRALFINLLNQQRRYGRNTVASIIAVWAPAADSNPTSAYIANVSRVVGVTPGAPLNLFNADIATRFARGIVVQENGSDPISAADYSAAFNAAVGAVS